GRGVDRVRPDQAVGAVDGQALHHVGEFDSAVVAFARIAFGVFVREDGAGGFEHGLGDEVFRGDQLEAFVLAAGFILNRRVDFRIGFGQRAVMIFLYSHLFSRFLLSPSSLLIFSIRRWWRPPSKSVVKKARTI